MYGMHYLDRLQLILDMNIRLARLELDLLQRRAAEAAPRTDSLHSNFMGKSHGLQGLGADSPFRTAGLRG